MFKPGDVVVCVNDANTSLVVGRNYTIESCLIKGEFVRVKELIDKVPGHNYRYRRFKLAEISLENK